MEIISEKNPGPPKVGRIEVQASGIGELDLRFLFAECFKKAVDETIGINPIVVAQAGWRLERVLDGAMVPHYNLYVFYDPLGAPEVALNPRNLNDATQNVLGQVIAPNDQLGGQDIGRQERKF